MCSLLSYSAIATKLRAMEGRFITAEQFKDLASQESVPAAVSFLRGLPAYEGIFSNLEDDDLHRGRIEQRLQSSLYRDFSGLYRFANVAQRKFLDLYFMHFEIDILKKCLRNSFSNKRADLNLSIFETFFNRHSGLDLVSLSQSTSLTEFISGLSGSYFHDPLNRLYESGVTSAFDYEINLDILYFNHIWASLKRDLTRSEQEVIRRCVGEKADLLNLEWISRAKQNYDFPAETIHSFLIPIYYRLSEEQVRKLEAAASPEEFMQILKTTYYKSRIPASIDSSGGRIQLRRLYRTLLDEVYHTSRQRNPYSAAALNSYLYFREEELRKIITAVEGIRYRLSRDEILSCLEES